MKEQAVEISSSTLLPLAAGRGGAALYALLALSALGLPAGAQTQNPSALGLTPRTFQALPGTQQILVLGASSDLWFEEAPFGHAPPLRQQVDAHVRTFQALDRSNIFVLGSDGVLWLEPAPFNRVPNPSRQQVDTHVWTFQALDAHQAFVLGTDGNLWLEVAPFNRAPNPGRQHIDANVKAFQALDPQNVLVLGDDGNLWLEGAPFGNLPPSHRTPIDAKVLSFQQPTNSTSLFVLGTDGNLWLEQPPFGAVPPRRRQIDANVKAFQASLLQDWAWVLGKDGKLWLEQGPFGQIPPANRQQVDANVRAFQGLDLQHALVLGSDANLWLEQGPFGQAQPRRQLVDADVQPFPLPGGPYLQSCTPLINIADALSASCTNYFGVTALGLPLMNSDTCIGTIQNINGALRCVVSKTVVTDSITETISVTSGSDANWDYNVWTIDEPNVVQPRTSYPQIRYHPGDTLEITAGGCVQTGGLGPTWKSYVHPQGEKADHLYFGQVTLPGTGLQSLEAIGGVVNKDWPVGRSLPPTIPESDLHLTLGYTDDRYDDNGYYRHDNGNNDQCLNLGPAWVQLTVKTPRHPSPSAGPVYSPGAKPFDLVWDVNNIDGNGLPYNPLWFPQSQELRAGRPLTTHDFGQLCGPAFITSTNPWGGYDVKVDEGVLAGDCSSQAPTPDLVGDNAAIPPVFNFGYCKDQLAPLPGHLNWGIVTYDGDLYFQNWSGGFPQDEDYNLALHRPDASGLAASLPGEEPAGSDCGLTTGTCPSILTEFKSLETFDAFRGSPWWQAFRVVAEHHLVPPGMTGSRAIVTGLLGIDGVHETGYTELHPVFSMAIQTDSHPGPQGGIDETWEYFIRTQGNEGSCSQMVHSWESIAGGPEYPQAAPYFIQLPWPKGATGVACAREGCGSAYPWIAGESLGKLQYTAGRWTYLQFNLTIDPMFDTGSGLGNNVGRASGFDGEIRLHYTLPPGVTPQLQLRPPQPATASVTAAKDLDAVDWAAILGSTTDPAVKARLTRLLASAPPATTPTSNSPLTFSPDFTVFQPRPSLGSKGVLTRSRDSLDWLTANQNANLQSAFGLAPQTFQALAGAPDIFVLDTDSNLWLDHPPFGRVPPDRQQVDRRVRTFQALDKQTVLVLELDGNLWLEHVSSGEVPPARQQIDGNVLSFQALDDQTIFVLGADRELWIEHVPFAQAPPARQQVDGNVRAFQALDAQQVLVVGSDDNLWLEQAPFGTVPPHRLQVDGNVWSFHSPHGSASIFVLGADGNLWLEQPPFGTLPPARRQIDANVHSFRALDVLNWVWVLGDDGKLWLDQGPFGEVPARRQPIDANVSAFQPLDLDHVLVLGTDRNLWMEQAPFGNIPSGRTQIDTNVR